MKPFRRFLPFVVAALCGCTPATSTHALLARELARLDAPGVQQNPEFASLKETAASGELLLAEGHERQAEELFRLALLKAEVLADAGRASAPPAGPASSSPDRLVPRAEPPTAGNDAVSAVLYPDPPSDDPPPVVDAPPPVMEEEPPAPLTEEPSPEHIELPPSAIAPPTRPAMEEQAPATVAGRRIRPETTYVVKRGDSLWSVAQMNGISVQQLARQNRLDPAEPLFPGRKLRILPRHIIPKIIDDGLVINIADRTLYHFKGGTLSAAVPVAVGRPKSATGGWETPTGTFRITAKLANPSWYVPASIRKEMQQKGKDVVTVVPAGPENPLGKYVLRTTIKGILIHGTNKPSSINGFSSHGCVRLLPAQMEELFRRVGVNAPGEIIYEPVKVARSDDGRVFVEVHRDVYRKVPDLDREVREHLRSLKLDRFVDWKKIRTVIADQSGVAEDVTL